MSNDVYVVPGNKEEMLLDLMHTSSSLPTARMRNRRIPHQEYKELSKLVQRLFISGPKSAQVVVFSAVEPGSGCTYICTRVAEILSSQLEERVCLVDTNHRSPGLLQHFDFENEVAAPQDEEWSFMPVGANGTPEKKSNLWLFSYRPASAESSGLANLRRFQMQLNELRKEFTYIVIDAAPLNEYADATAFARMADGLVMVVEANNTRREIARNAKEVLDANDIPILGTVLNKRTYPIPESVYRRL